MATTSRAVEKLSIQSAPWDEAHAWLRAKKGIGAWSAVLIMLRGIGHMERLMVGEARLGDVIARVYNGGTPVGDDEVAAFAAPYVTSGATGHTSCVWRGRITTGALPRAANRRDFRRIG